MPHFPRRVSFLAFILATSGSIANAQESPFGSYDVLRAGLYGPQYTGTSGYQLSTLAQQGSIVSPIRPHAMILGASQRVTGVSTARGFDAWMFDPSTGVTTLMGLDAPIHTGTNGHHESLALLSGASGLVAGTSKMFRPTETGRHVWCFDPATGVSTQIGLTSSDHTRSDGLQSSLPRFMTDSGQVAGVSSRYIGSLQRGQDAWVYDPALLTTIRIGLLTPAQFQPNGIVFNQPFAQAESGHVAGTATRYLGTSQSLGQNAWCFDPQDGLTTEVGLTTPEYTGSTGYQESEVAFVGATGRVVGTSRRISGVSTSRGLVAWQYNPASGTTTQLGLQGPEYIGSEGYIQSLPKAINARGDVGGVSYAVTGVQTPAGVHSWLYEAATGATVKIGLTGPQYTGSSGFQSSMVTHMNELGQVAGCSEYITGVNTLSGRATWIYNPATQVTTRTGLTSPAFMNEAGYNSGITSGLRDSGQAYGIGHRTGTGVYLGYSMWSYEPTTGLCRQAGLTDAVHTGSEGYQRSTSTAFNNVGDIAGESLRLTVGEQSNGRSTWLFNGQTGETVQIGLIDPDHFGPEGQYISEISTMNDARVVVGETWRKAGGNGGLDSWYFDGATGVHYRPLEGVPNAIRSDGYRLSGAHFLTEDGFLIGSYASFLNGVDPMRNGLYLYRPDLGFGDFDSLVAGGLSASGWTGIQHPIAHDGMNIIVGHGVFQGQSISDGSGSVFVARRVSLQICASDVDDGTGSGNPNGGVDVNALLYFLGAFEAGTDAADLDDGSGTGTPSGGVDVNDLIFFLAHFEAGC